MIELEIVRSVGGPGDEMRQLWRPCKLKQPEEFVPSALKGARAVNILCSKTERWVLLHVLCMCADNGVRAKKNGEGENDGWRENLHFCVWVRKAGRARKHTDRLSV